jgi:hypothetical protein
MRDYDERDFLHSAVVVPWNDDDPETAANRERLERLLLGAFETKTAPTRAHSFSGPVGSAEELRSKLSRILCDLHQQVVETAEVFRRAVGPREVARPQLSNGKRVLAVDWDLEAPGLHRYFHPFLLDPELTSSPGVIDLVWAFASEAVRPVEPSGEASGEAPGELSSAEADPGWSWYKAHADVLRYATALDWDFPPPGRLDLLPAGRQGDAYAARVNAFNWHTFYDRLGGGAFLEAVKASMREYYDYILIDSHTGVSDTSGVCTVQMPDSLVVCYTASRQSIAGAAAVADSVRAQWAALEKQEAKAGEPRRVPRRIFPVFMRAELGQKEKLDAAREYARSAFAALLDHVWITPREDYWGQVETLYVPYYAYEEVLATFGDRPGNPNTVLAATERLTMYLTDGAVKALVPLPEDERERVLRQFNRAPRPSKRLLSILRRQNSAASRSTPRP